MSIRIRFRQFVYLRNAASPPKIRMITISCPRINERTIFQLTQDKRSSGEWMRTFSRSLVTTPALFSGLVPG